MSWKPSMRFIDLCGVVGDITQVLLEVFTDLASLMLSVLTVTALAQGLKVSPSALYNHVRSKQDVLVLVQDHIMTKVAVEAFASES